MNIAMSSELHPATVTDLITSNRKMKEYIIVCLHPTI